MPIISKNNKGFSLVEVIVACAIISLSVFSLLSAAQKGIALSNKALRETQASLLLEEGTEAVKTIRDASWSTISGLTLNTNYYLSYDNTGNLWSLSTTPVGAIDSIFTRTVSFSAVNRNGTDDIASSGTLDTRTKKVTITVSWQASDSAASKSLNFYIADIFN